MLSSSRAISSYDRVRNITHSLRKKKNGSTPIHTTDTWHQFWNRTRTTSQLCCGEEKRFWNSVHRSLHVIIWIAVRRWKNLETGKMRSRCFVRGVRALVFEFSSSIECVTVSRLRHRPTRSTRKSLEHQHSNTTLEHRWSSCLRVHVTKTGSFSMCNLSSTRDGYASISQVHDRIRVV